MSASKLGVNFLKQISNYMSKSNTFDCILRNLVITGGGDGKCQAELLIGQEHLNPYGGLHGGFTATLVDNVTTYALMSKPSHPGVSVDLQIMYLKPAAEGQVITVEANTIRAEKDLAYIDCELRLKNDGTLIAKGGQMKYVNFE